MKPIRALIVDDSALMRDLLRQILESDPAIEVVGAAGDPFAARDKIKKLQPNVVTLDVEMPRMDGLTFLEKLMRLHPLPVLMISSLTEKGCETTLRALELGAIDFVAKPKLDLQRQTLELAEEIVAKVKVAARARVHPTLTRPNPVAAADPVPAGVLFPTTHRVIAVGASTGGTQALHTLLAAMPADAPGMLIVQHMPPGYTRSFAARLNQLSRVEVREAQDGDRVHSGLALLAPGDLQMQVRRDGAERRVRVCRGERVNRHRPSVDVLFHSCARELGRNAIGVLLTGMGSDGAQGLRAMHERGARTIVQDEKSCVVFGMPKEAIALGGVDEIAPLTRIAPIVLRWGQC